MKHDVFNYLERVKYLIPCPHLLLKLSNVTRDGAIIIPLLSSNMHNIIQIHDNVPWD